MKKIFVLFLFVAFSLMLHAQTLFFCEGVDSSGHIFNPDDSFYIGENGGHITLYVSLDKKLFADYVEFNIYKFDNNIDEEVFDNIIHVDAAYDWTFFWKQIAFYNTGVYRVHVMNDEQQQICEGKVTILKK